MKYPTKFGKRYGYLSNNSVLLMQTNKWAKMKKLKHKGITLNTKYLTSY